MYDADPFAAQAMVHERQAKAAQRKEDASKLNRADDSRLASRVPSEYPEVIMATALRELVENAVKKVPFLSLFHLSLEINMAINQRVLNFTQKRPTAPR